MNNSTPFFIASCVILSVCWLSCLDSLNRCREINERLRDELYKQPFKVSRYENKSYFEK